MVVRLLDEFIYDFQLVNLCIILDSRLLSEQLINDFIDSLQRHLYFVNASYLFTHISYRGKTYTITAQEPSINVTSFVFHVTWELTSKIDWKNIPSLLAGWSFLCQLFVQDWPSLRCGWFNNIEQVQRGTLQITELLHTFKTGDFGGWFVNGLDLHIQYRSKTGQILLDFECHWILVTSGFGIPIILHLIACLKEITLN